MHCCDDDGDADESELLLKHAAAVVSEPSAVSGRAVATVTILTALNLLSFMDRLTIAGQSTCVLSFTVITM